MLTEMQALSNRSEFARLLGFSPSSLAYILFKQPDSIKYSSFSIPKKDGTLRFIHAPNASLSLIQSRLAAILEACCSEIGASATNTRILSHGFVRGASIYTNALAHTRQRYVFNFDLEGYFDAFNFGRVRGFFIANNKWALQPDVATTIAQIACLDNRLPQGSPCSPIITNIIGHLLDIRMVQLAKQEKCVYSRYVDDITFSTSLKNFPSAIAIEDTGCLSGWTVSAGLENTIIRMGFAVKHSKTRMQHRNKRQTVTGLTVNRHVNIRREYYRLLRSMCASLFKDGIFYRKSDLAPPKSKTWHSSASKDDLSGLHGMLSHLFWITDRSDRRKAAVKKQKPSGARQLYRFFLFWKNFQNLERPLIVCEGKTDVTYLKLAIKSLSAGFPNLIESSGSAKTFKISFLNYTRSVHDVLQLGGGTGDLKFLLMNYKENCAHFKFAPRAHPIIVLIDNDEGAKDIFSSIKSKVVKCPTFDSADDFYHIYENMYLIKTIEPGAGGYSYIESAFEDKILKTKIDGKDFSPLNKFDIKTHYGKQIFAERVIRKKAGSINFSGFNALLKRIDAVIADYAVRKA